MYIFRTVRAAALCVAALVISGPRLAAIQLRAPDFRLPNSARPTRYQLDLTILPNQPTFDGSEKISIDLAERTDTVWLNAKDLKIQEINVEAAGRSQVARWRVSGEFLAIELAAPVGPGSMEIEIRYIGMLDDKSTVGAYRQKSGNDWYVYTSFTPIDARRAFPCFDEPGYKARWEIVLHVQRDEVALSNAPAVSTEDEPDGMKRVAFAPTPLLASEIVAFAVGPFDVVDAGMAGQKRIPVRIITPRGRAAEAAAASTATAEILERLEQYTGIPYPWDKLDHIALLGMPFGATENPGLITYQANILLAAPNEDTQQRQKDMRYVMTHELAHQWFGNLVTQAWWNDVWLSEGFATWLETKVSDMGLPAFERGFSMTEIRDFAMKEDSLDTRPVRIEMHSRKDTDGVYDRVIYVKGASILQMLEDWLGREEFQHALHRYLVDHQFGNATSSDLVTAIKQESGVDVGQVLFGFLDRPGAPTLHFSIAPAKETVKFEVEQGANLWTVPVCYHVEGTERRCELVGTAHTELHLFGPPPTWIWPNAYGSGYYRSLLTAKLLDALIEKGYAQLEGPERLALAGDLEGLTSTGPLPAAEVMKILPQISRDLEPRIQAHVSVITLDLAVIAPDAVRENYAQWLKKTMDVTLASPEQAKSVDEFLRDKH